MIKINIEDIQYEDPRLLRIFAKCLIGVAELREAIIKNNMEGNRDCSINDTIPNIGDQPGENSHEVPSMCMGDIPEISNHTHEVASDLSDVPFSGCSDGGVVVTSQHLLIGDIKHAPFNPKVHVSPTSKNKDGTWTKKRNRKSTSQETTDEPLIPPPPLDPKAFPNLMTKITSATTSGQLTIPQVLDVIKSVGLTDIPSIAKNLHLVPVISTTLDRMINSVGEE